MRNIYRSLSGSPWKYLPHPINQTTERSCVQSTKQPSVQSTKQPSVQSTKVTCVQSTYMSGQSQRAFLLNIIHFSNPLLLMPNEEVYFLWAYTCTNALRALSTQKKSKAESNMLNISIYYSAIYKITYKKKVSWNKGKSAQRCDITFLNFSPVYFYRSPSHPTIMSRFIHITIFYLYQKRHNKESSTLWGIECHFTRAKVPL